MKEYIWQFDGFIVLPEGVDAEAFAEAAWDKVLEYAEANGVHIGGTYRVQEYKEEEDDG